MRKLGLSEYTGTPEAWVKFLTAWNEKAGVHLERNAGFDMEAYVRNFPIDAPASYKHFMAAWESFGKGNIIPVSPLDGRENDCFFNIRAPKDVECLALLEAGKSIIELKFDETLPRALARDDYYIYSSEQDYMPVYEATVCNFVVADYEDGEQSYLTLNPLVRTDDGEWEAACFDFAAPSSHRFMSFADLMVFLYLNDIEKGDAVFWLSHKEDFTGLSKILFG